MFDVSSELGRRFWLYKSILSYTDLISEFLQITLFLNRIADVSIKSMFALHRYSAQSYFWLQVQLSADWNITTSVLLVVFQNCILNMHNMPIFGDIRSFPMLFKVFECAKHFVTRKSFFFFLIHLYSSCTIMHKH